MRVLYQRTFFFCPSCCNPSRLTRKKVINIKANYSASTTESVPPVTGRKDQSQINMLRARFASSEEILANGLDRKQLSESEWQIHLAHQKAIEKRLFTYDDPLTGAKVMTRLCHFLRGKCCGSACRHVRYFYL